MRRIMYKLARDTSLRPTFLGEYNRIKLLEFGVGKLGEGNVVATMNNRGLGEHVLRNILAEGRDEANTNR